MGLSQIRQVERDALCSTLHEVGADAPTLCSAWSAIDVAAHLVVSEAYGGWPMVAAYRLRRFLPPAVTRTGTGLGLAPRPLGRRAPGGVRETGGGFGALDRGVDPPRGRPAGQRRRRASRFGRDRRGPVGCRLGAHGLPGVPARPGRART